MSGPLPCLVCHRRPDTACPGRGDEPDQPHGATVFHTYGQYGSTAFDPQDDSRLEVNICDPCLLERAGSVWHCRHVRRPAVTLFAQPWNPAGDG